MKSRDSKKRYMLYPEDHIRVNWDVTISVALIISALFTPVVIGFNYNGEFSTRNWEIFNLCFDVIFSIDILINFVSAVHNDDFDLIDDHKQVALYYLRGWFILDFLAIVPFDIILSSSSNFNGMVRIARLGRAYKFLKLTKLIRIMKVLK